MRRFCGAWCVGGLLLLGGLARGEGSVAPAVAGEAGEAAPAQQPPSGKPPVKPPKEKEKEK
jgi:hypothetical protein